MAVPHEVLARVASCLPPCDRAALALAGRAAAAAVAASWTALRVPAGVLAAASPGHGRLRRHSGVRLLAITAAAGTGATPAAPAVAALLPAPEVLARLYELDCSAAGSAFWEATLAAAQRSGVPLTAALAAGAPHLQRLSLSCDLWYAPALAALQRACASAVPQMVKLLATTLARSGEVGLTLQPLAPLAALPSLRSLSLTGKPLPPPAAAQLPALTALHALSFNAALCCDDSALAHSLGGLTALTSLCLEHLPSHTGGVFAGLTGVWGACAQAWPTSLPACSTPVACVRRTCCLLACASGLPTSTPPPPPARAPTHRADGAAAAGALWRGAHHGRRGQLGTPDRAHPPAAAGLPCAAAAGPHGAVFGAVRAQLPVRALPGLRPAPVRLPGEWQLGQGWCAACAALRVLGQGRCTAAFLCAARVCPLRPYMPWLRAQSKGSWAVGSTQAPRTQQRAAPPSLTHAPPLPPAPPCRRLPCCQP